MIEARIPDVRSPGPSGPAEFPPSGGRRRSADRASALMCSSCQRHQVVWHIIEDATVIPAVNGMARFAAMGYSDSPTPVSPHVFWWNGTSYEQLTEVPDDGGLAIRVSPAFQAVLESITADR